MFGSVVPFRGPRELRRVYALSAQSRDERSIEGSHRQEGHRCLRSGWGAQRPEPEAPSTFSALFLPMAHGLEASGRNFGPRLVHGLARK
jgi:hypothetical protein